MLRTAWKAAFAVVVASQVVTTIIFPYFDAVNVRYEELEDAFSKRDSFTCVTPQERLKFLDHCAESERKAATLYPYLAAIYDLASEIAVCNNKSCKILGIDVTGSFWLIVLIAVICAIIASIVWCCFQAARRHEETVRLLQLPIRN